MNESRGEDLNWLLGSFTLSTTCATRPLLEETSTGFFFGAQMTLRIIEEVGLDSMFSVVIFWHRGSR